jgi:hypothetical protein
MDRMTDRALPPALEAALEELDARATARAARVDVEAVAARVRERLRHEAAPERRVLGMPRRALRIAAAVAVLAAAGAVVTLTRPRPRQTAALQLPVTIPAAALDTAQLEAVLKAAGEVRPVVDTVAPAAASGSYDDLSERQLQTLLASLKGAEG